MKTKLLMLSLAAAVTLFASCDRDDDNIRVDSVIDYAFHSRYPSVTRVEWERKNNYYVADFWRNNTESEAWYDRHGIWCMTETDVRYSDLPYAVKTAFERSEYAAWRIDDIDMLEYPDGVTVYIIETEKGDAECDLYFTPDGVLIKTVPEGNIYHTGGGNNTGTHQPPTILPAVKTFIAEKYPQAWIVDLETERNTVEVDIVDDRTPREVVFSLTGEWIYTKTEVRKTNIPAVVLDVLNASQYRSWRIDDIDHYVTPANEYYLIELESGNREVLLKIDINGNLLL